MRVLQTVFGVFHHFELARELQRRGHLEAIFSTFPWQRLKREGLPHSRVRTFPWLHTLDLLCHRLPFDLHRLNDEIGYRNALAFDRWTLGQLHSMEREGTRIDALIGISGSSLLAGRHVQQNGGLFVCDRGSTHQRFQEQVVQEEYRRWGVDRPSSDARDTVREEAIYAVADAITVPSTAAARSFITMGVPPEKLHVIPYGVRLEQFRPIAEPDSDRFDVLFAGSVGLRKGVPYLLEAFARLRHPAKRLRVAGPIQVEIKPVLATLPTEGVEFLGAVPQDRLIDLMSRSHALVLPSVEEGLALVQAQALACGCPVVCSEATGGEDLFTDGIEGFVVPVRDVDALAGRMQQLADDSELRSRMRQAALAHVRAIGGWETYGSRWEALLKRLVSAKSGIAAEDLRSADRTGSHFPI